MTFSNATLASHEQKKHVGHYLKLPNKVGSLTVQPVSWDAYKYTCLPTCIDIYMPKYMQSYAYMHIHRLVFVFPIYIPRYRHSYSRHTYTYMHACTFLYVCLYANIYMQTTFMYAWTHT